MKEATAELNLTVITVIAIAAIAALFTLFVWPTIKKSIATNTCKSSYGSGYVARDSDSDGTYDQCYNSDTGDIVDTDSD